MNHYIEQSYNVRNLLIKTSILNSKPPSKKHALTRYRRNWVLYSIRKKYSIGIITQKVIYEGNDLEQIDVNLQDQWGYTVLIYASYFGYINGAELVLSLKGIDVNLQDGDGWTALMYSSRFGYPECVKLLLRAENINVNLQNNVGGTALIIASRCGNYKCIGLLLTIEDGRQRREGIDVNIKDCNGWTALTYSSREGHSECQELLTNF